jgi:uncharacterized protein YjbJ (UPF0337 family)
MKQTTGMKTEQAKAKASEAAPEMKGKAHEMAGEAKGKASETAPGMTGKAQEMAGEVKGKGMSTFAIY